MRRILTVSAVLCIVGLGFAQVDTPYSVATWRGFCSAAVTWTFDDGIAVQHTKIRPMFDAKGFKMTFYVGITTMNPGWATLDTAFAHGHEIASHTMDHPQSLASQSVAQQITELRNSRDSIMKHVPGEQCIDIAYPNCNQATDSLQRKYYLAGRICGDALNPKTPPNPMAISCFICGKTGKFNAPKPIDSLANLAVKTNGWTVYLVHDIDNGSGYSPTQSTAIAGALAYFDTSRATYWLETFGNVFRYIRERNAATVKVQATAADSITLRVTDTLVDSIFNYPITLRRPLPDGWQTAGVMQAGVAVPSRITDSNSVRYLAFDVVPDKGDVTIGKNLSSVRTDRTRQVSRGFMTRLTRTGLSFVVPASAGPHLSIAIYGLNGARLAGCKCEATPGGWGSVVLPGRLRNHGVFIIKATDGRSTWSRQEVR